MLRIEDICMQCRCTPTQTDQYKDQSKDILNSILKDELSDSDTMALIAEL